MSTLLYGINRASVPGDEKDVRSTVTVVDNDAESAVIPDSPEWNEIESDPDTHGGLTRRNVGGHVIPSVQYKPYTGDSNEDHNAIVNRQISSSGTAAQRELNGEWGHGTLMVTESLEPTIRDGAAFGEQYFAVGERPIQEPAGNYMTPSETADPDTMAAVQAAGNQNSRRAVAASQYALFHAATTGQA